MKMKMFYLCIILIFVNLLFACNKKESEYSLYQFIGPEPGYKYTYYEGDDVYMEVIGVLKDENGIEVEEIMHMNNYNFLEGFSDHLRNKYILTVAENALIRKRENIEQIILHEPLIPGSINWEFPVRVVSIESFPSGDITSSDSVGFCRIIKTGKELILGEERFIIKTECKSKQKLPDIIIYQKYADSIGLVESIFKGRVDNKMVEISRIYIKEIDKIRH